MNDEKLKYYKELLTRWLDDLLGHAGEAVLRIRESDYFPDPLDRASFDSERSFQLRIRDRESILIKKIKNSLQDIDEGIYGDCKNCGRKISLKRLEARPVAQHCIRCKTAMEHMEKLTGT